MGHIPKHAGSFLLLCLLWIVFLLTFINVEGYWYSVSSALDIAKKIVAYIVGVAFLSTIIITVMLHRVNNTLNENGESKSKKDEAIIESISGIKESIDKLNERLKTVARMVDDIKGIEQKISERPPVIIQKKEQSDK